MTTGLLGAAASRSWRVGQRFSARNLRYVEVVRRIADRHGDDPLAGLGFAREVGDAVLDVLDRTHGPERRINTLEAFPIHVSMTVD
jgi:hypothetical protein